MRGKLWSIEQERQLRKLVEEGVGIADISKVMGKTRVSVRSKMYHLGLTVVDAAALPPTIAVLVASIASVASTPEPIVDHATHCHDPSQVAVSDHPPTADSASAACPCEVDALAIQAKSNEPLPTIEEQLHVLNSAIVAMQRPSISRSEVARQSKIIEGVKVYNDLFAKFVDYRGLEIKVLELERRLAGEKNS
ncbi:MAG TPA: hypothetical protein VK253_07990 [Candidatus Binatia bacterium]|nr:hypothetical protein [Candidatus Binatia bacterium]